MKRLLIIFTILFITISNVHAVDITQKIGGSNIGANSYFAATRAGNSYALELGYFYNGANSADAEFVDKYNLRSAISGNNNNPNKTMFYFVMSYCSNVGASITSISNTNYNFIDLNFNTYTTCTVNNGSQYYTATLWNMYFRMSPTGTNVGNSSYEAILFANTINVASQYSYNGYVGFNSLSILTRDEYESYLQSQKELNNQNTIIDNQNAIINGQNTIINGQNTINNSIKDETNPNTSNFLSNWTALLLNNNAINQILVLPLNLLNKFKSAISGTCSPITINFGLTGGNETITLPCWSITDYVGQNLSDLISGMVGFYLIYNFALFLWKFYDDFTSMKDTLSIMMSTQSDSLVVKGDDN